MLIKGQVGILFETLKAAPGFRNAAPRFRIGAGFCYKNVSMYFHKLFSPFKINFQLRMPKVWKPTT